MVMKQNENCKSKEKTATFVHNYKKQVSPFPKTRMNNAKILDDLFNDINSQDTNILLLVCGVSSQSQSTTDGITFTGCELWPQVHLHFGLNTLKIKFKCYLVELDQLTD